MSKGLFITFEGIDGCGKSTQLVLLKALFEERDISFREIREPGGTVIGEKIREILLDKKNTSMAPMAELLLFEAARAQICEEVIRPSLEDGITVICDRFFDSTSAYQGYAGNADPDVINFLNSNATSGLTPDVTFVLDIDPEAALRRRQSRGEEDRIELMGLEYQKKVRAGYLEISKLNPDRIVLLDASRSPEEIFGDISDKIWTLMG